MTMVSEPLTVILDFSGAVAEPEPAGDGFDSSVLAQPTASTAITARNASDLGMGSSAWRLGSKSDKLVTISGRRSNGLETHEPRELPSPPRVTQKGNGAEATARHFDESDDGAIDLGVASLLREMLVAKGGGE